MTPAAPDPPVSSKQSETRHATCVAIDGAGVLIEGPSGTGKSALALQLIALGAVLVADDMTRVELREAVPCCFGPPRLAGVIEARGVGLLRVPHLAVVPLRLIVDMGAAQTKRLPSAEWENILGHQIARVRRVDGPHFPAAIVMLAKGGWYDEG